MIEPLAAIVTASSFSSSAIPLPFAGSSSASDVLLPPLPAPSFGPRAMSSSTAQGGSTFALGETNTLVVLPVCLSGLSSVHMRQEGGGFDARGGVAS